MSVRNMRSQKSGYTSLPTMIVLLTASDRARRWFGLILLPFVSFSADGVIAILFFMESTYDHITGKRTQTPSMLARGRAIDLSIQFTLWWMPFLVLLGWFTARPMHLLFGASLCIASRCYLA